jgi:hypothetical protein
VLNLADVGSLNDVSAAHFDVAELRRQQERVRLEQQGARAGTGSVG